MPLFCKDQMTDAERGMALMMGKPIDRVPFMLFALGFNGKSVGYSIFDMYDDMAKSIDAGFKAAEMYGAMGGIMAGFPAIGPWELGGEMKWPKGEFAQCPNAEPAATTEEEAWNLKLPTPEKLRTLGYIPRWLQIGQIASQIGVPFTAAAYGVWTTAGNIVGVSNLTKWSLKKPDLVNHLLDFSRDFLLMWLKILVDDFGPQSIIAVNSTASAANNIISPKTFKDFVLPHTIKYHQKIIEMGIQSIMVHICGEQNDNYEFYKDIPLPPASQISVSHEVDLEKASKTFPNYVILGNVEPALFQSGTPEQVYEACRIAIEKGKKHKRGFILGPGCEMPPGAVPYNVYMMAKACNDFGYYD